MSKKFWKEEEVEYLIKNFKNNKSSDLATLLNKSNNGIIKKAQKLNLKKNKKYISEMANKRNKLINATRKIPLNRNLTNETLKNIALKYKTRYEFQKNDSRAYAVCIKQKILNDVCSHMFNKKYSTPQLLLFEILKIIFPNVTLDYNNRTLIKPYEIDIYIREYNLGFEYNGKYWHSNNINDNKKINLCNKKGINLIIIKEKSKNFCLDIKNQLIDNLEKINTVCNMSVKDIDILNINENELYTLIKNNILSDNDVKKIVNKYVYFSDFRINEQKLYIMLINKKLLEKYTAHLIRKKIKWNLEIIDNIINKYKIYSDFIKENICCYKYIKAHKLDYLLIDLKRNNLNNIKQNRNE
jgi:hypothetical protein